MKNMAQSRGTGWSRRKVSQTNSWDCRNGSKLNGDSKKGRIPNVLSGAHSMSLVPCWTNDKPTGFFKNLVSSLLFECYCKKCSILEGFISENFGKNKYKCFLKTLQTSALGIACSCWRHSGICINVLLWILIGVHRVVKMVKHLLFLP